MADQLLPLPQPAQTQRRRGRPPGAKGKRSTDLGRYIEATFGGTPGQQAAQLALVSPREVKNAKADARALGLFDLVELGLPDAMLAQVVKAHRLAIALRCDPRDAWLLMQKEREGLMPYVHQRQPQKAEEKPGAKRATVYVIPDGDAPAAPQQLASGDDETLAALGFGAPGSDEVT